MVVSQNALKVGAVLSNTRTGGFFSVASIGEKTEEGRIPCSLQPRPHGEALTVEFRCRKGDMVDLFNYRVVL